MYFYNKNYDCIKLTISAILRDRNINIYSLWPHFGIYKLKKERTFYPYLLSTEKQLKHFNNIDMNYYSFKNEIEFKNKIESCFHEKKSLIIVVDIYTLPCNVYFNNKHNLHYVELRKCNDNYKIIDHYYKDFMEVSFKTLCNILNNSYLFGITQKLEFIDINDYKSNLLINKDKIIHQQINNLKIKIIHSNLYSEFIDYIMKCCNDLDNTIDELHTTLKEFGQSRYHAANFVTISNVTYKENLVDLLSRNSNLFFNIANIILKHYIQKKIIPKETLNNLLNEILKNEKKISEMGDDYYENK